jgi:hypothetical protein
VYKVPDTEGKLETGSGAPMGEDPTAPTEAFETWLLCRVAQTVEAGEVPADLLTELQAAFEDARDRPQAQSQADAVQDIAIELQMPIQTVEAALAALEAQPRVIRKVVVRRIAKAWLEGQREARRSHGAGGSRA